MTILRRIWDAVYLAAVLVHVRVFGPRQSPSDVLDELARFFRERPLDEAEERQAELDYAANSVALSEDVPGWMQQPPEPPVKTLTAQIAQRLPFGTFDDDPGGPWRAPGVKCECATSGRQDCQDMACPHRLDRRPGWTGS